MKQNWKKILLAFLGVFAVIILSGVLYLHISFSGNPIEKWEERRAVLKIYEERYDQEFKVEGSSYDYKRNEFTFILYPEENPSMTFRSTIDETNNLDAYSEARSTTEIKNIILEALSSDFDYLNYKLHVSEDSIEEGAFEKDLEKRIKMNNYRINFSWDVDRIDSDEIDLIFEEIINKIKTNFELEVGEVKLWLGAYDGKDFYKKDQIIRSR